MCVQAHMASEWQQLTQAGGRGACGERRRERQTEVREGGKGRDSEAWLDTHRVRESKPGFGASVRWGQGSLRLGLVECVPVSDGGGAPSGWIRASHRGAGAPSVYGLGPSSAPSIWAGERNHKGIWLASLPPLCPFGHHTRLRPSCKCPQQGAEIWGRC